MCDKIAAVSKKEIKTSVFLLQMMMEKSRRDVGHVICTEIRIHFLCIKQGYRNIKVLYSLDLLIAPFEKEEDNQHHNNYIISKVN